MEELFRWALGTAAAIALLTFGLNFITPSLGVKLVLALIIALFALIRGIQKYGVPESAFRDGGIIGMAAMAGLLIVQTTDVLEFAITLLLFAGAYFLCGFAAKLVLRKPKEPEQPGNA